MNRRDLLKLLPAPATIRLNHRSSSDLVVGTKVGTQRTHESPQKRHATRLYPVFTLSKVRFT